MMNGWTAIVAICVLYAAWRQSRPRRSKAIPAHKERVLILGASSGIGRSMALQYAARGARLCIVGRRLSELEKVKLECLPARPAAATNISPSVLCIPADFTNPEDMVRLRSEIEKAWGGLDTLVVCAGLSALRPLLEIPGLENPSSPKSTAQATVHGIQQTVDIVDRATRGNYTGPLVAALTFIPLLQFNSLSPSIVLLSSLAAVVPAPTRSIYASTKGAALLLYQSLAIEHPAITFSFIMPATVQSDFRRSAVDVVPGAPVPTADVSKKSIKVEDVARRCIRAADSGDKFVFMPVAYGRGGHLLYWLLPWIVERLASRKYGFSSK